MIELSSVGAFMMGDSSPFFLTLETSNACYINGGGMQKPQPSYIVSSSLGLVTIPCFINTELEPSLVPGALFFDRTLKQYARLPDASAYDNLEAYTFNVWVKAPPYDGQANPVVYSQGNLEIYADKLTNSFKMTTYITQTEIVLGQPMLVRRAFNAGSPTYTPNRWNMLTIRTTAASADFYFNGQKFYSQIVSDTPSFVPKDWYDFYFGYDGPDAGNGRNEYGTNAVANALMVNYALHDDEILAMYSPPHWKVCIKAYMEGRALESVYVSTRAFVNSPYSSTNPGIATASVGCCFGTKKEEGVMPAFVVAGGEEERKFDTRIVIDRKSYRSFDNVLFIGDSTTRIRGGQNGNVVYPITREATKRTRVPTSFDPYRMRDNMDVWLNSYYTLSESREAYIGGPEFQVGITQAYLHGDFTPADLSLGAMVVNNGTDAPLVECYIDGVHVFEYDLDPQPCYLHGYTEDIEGDTLSFTAGYEATEASLEALINAPDIQFGYAQAFIMSVADELRTYNRGYMRGGRTIIKAQPAMVQSHTNESNFTPAFLHATFAEVSSTLCFVQSENLYKTRKFAWVRARDIATDSQMLYLKSGLSVSDSQLSFTRGLGSAFRARRCFIGGEVVIPATTSRLCSITGEYSSYSVKAFIVSRPEVTVDCYIMSRGTLATSRKAVVVG